MRYWFLILVCTVTACAPAARIAENLPEAPPPQPPELLSGPVTFGTPTFVFQGEDPGKPLMTNEPSAGIKNLYINPGSVIFHNDQFHMLFNSFTAWPGTVLIGYARSQDGLLWEIVQEEPVFSSEQVPFGNGRADVSSAQVLDDGTWVMYFHTVSSGIPPMVIGRATASSPLGPWVVDADPILVPGPKGAWDEQSLFWPNVVRDEDGYRMYYGARDNQANYAIGMALSQDGVSWTKYNDLATDDPRFVDSDPVLQPGAEWEDNKVDRPRVQNTPDGWVMIYQGGPIVENRGLAISNDGLDWTAYNDNPLFTRESFPIPNAKTWDTALLYHEGVYYYYMEIGTLQGTNIFLATHRGALRQ